MAPLYEIIQVRPSCLITYPCHDSMAYFSPKERFDGPLDDIRNEFYSSLKNECNNEAKGQLSNRSRRRMRYAIELIIAQASDKKSWYRQKSIHIPFKVNFLTLTLSAPAPTLNDKIIKQQLLKIFLKNCTNKYGLKSYVWRAETQVNKRLHFHIITDTYIHWQDVRKTWNIIQQKHGIIDKYRQLMQNWHRDGFKVRPKLLYKWNYNAQLNAYKTGMLEHWNNPNSTDIHAISHIENLSNYVTKYMSKDSDNSRLVEGKIWGCSNNLNGKYKCEVPAVNDVMYQLQNIKTELRDRVIDKDYIQIITLTPQLFDKFITGTIKKHWDNYLYQVRHKTLSASIYTDVL